MSLHLSSFSVPTSHLRLLSRRRKQIIIFLFNLRKPKFALNSLKTFFFSSKLLLLAFFLKRFYIRNISTVREKTNEIHLEVLYLFS